MNTETSRDIEGLLDELKSWRGRPLKFMEVCGTHTMAAARTGLRKALPDAIRLISGPGCPVCVTPIGYVDHALALAKLPDVAITTFGDLMRVPGSERERDGAPNNLLRARADGADVRVVYSSRDALALAAKYPQKQIVFLGVGFETTAPGLAATVAAAKAAGRDNFSMLLAAKTIPEAMLGLAGSVELGLDGFLCPGHVSVILGEAVYRDIAAACNLPCVIAGFEPLEMLRGVVALKQQVEVQRADVINCYKGAVKPSGNPKALEVMYRVFEPRDSIWRGLGEIPHSGLGIRDSYREFDAARKFEVTLVPPIEPAGCRCGEVLSGTLDPAACGLFGKICTPDHPKGACMVSQEGSCAARYLYGVEK